ncbi:toll/interleukin-1 receptor domain-containing protein [Bacillus mycoides]|uniref:toll/interleukin-1 receptor domain-containing protein n=1 Tax=Bacillus mycoides TaxID=1405 RepID=UPI001C018CCF|nr:toll/interleukin-1 receptor domain-containing protein [Bacillus mycoides]QWG59925.1 TIR domain-containing protein [Bacillus mycoides]QWJ04889.1 toll/interleukin-1 receptor domain-containing protein [Bacillus mycoides]
MKVFLSWSGSESRQLATIFKEWLPNVLQYVDPYMSAQDIAMGERWGNSIADNLEESVFGLIFVTPSNIKAPWINFEAGALSKTFESRVIPILYRAEVTLLDQGPLKQFQSSKNLEKDSILSLIQSINISNQEGRLDETRLEKAFEMWWPDLEEAINAIVKEEGNESAEGENGPTDRDLLNVIYSKLVEQEKTINQQKNLQEIRIAPRIPSGLIKEVQEISKVMKICGEELANGEFSEENVNNLEAGARSLGSVARYLENQNRKIADSRREVI